MPVVTNKLKQPPRWVKISNILHNLKSNMNIEITVDLKGHHYKSFQMHIKIDVCGKILCDNVYIFILHIYVIILHCINKYLAWIHNYLACIHNHLTRDHNYLACIQN